MINFYRFFKELYKERPLCKEAEDLVRNHKERDKRKDPQSCTITYLSDTLNKHITVEELEASLKKLKNGKASGVDGVTNEALKALKASPLTLQKALDPIESPHRKPSPNIYFCDWGVLHNLYNYYTYMI